jgi:IclR family acetate operon transcriptional repressor
MGRGSVVQGRKGVVEGVAEGRDRGVQVISRAAHVLRSLATRQDGMTVANVANDLELPRSTTHRILQALSKEGLTRRTATGRYTLGFELGSLASAARSDLLTRAAPHMLRLGSRLGETVELTVLSGPDVMLMDRSVSRHSLRATSEIGRRLPAHATAGGKALLAALPRSEVEQLLPRALEPLTPATITSRDALLDELESVRSGGTAADVEEHAAGVCSVAVVVGDRGGEAAALCIVVPAARYELRSDFEAALLRERRQIQHELGATSPATGRG